MFWAQFNLPVDELARNRQRPLGALNR